MMTLKHLPKFIVEAASSSQFLYRCFMDLHRVTLMLEHMCDFSTPGPKARPQALINSVNIPCNLKHYFIVLAIVHAKFP